MFSGSEIPRDVIQAYMETHYHVHGNAPTTLKVGEANAALASLHEAAGVACSAFITACNPFSEKVDDVLNVERQQAFAHALRQRGLSFIDGVGQHPTNGWAGEASFLALGLTLEDARALGTQHGQNAIIWSGADAVPQLILLR